MRVAHQQKRPYGICRSKGGEDSMNIYKLTLTDRWGAPFVVTVPAASLYDAMSSVVLDPGWMLREYSIMGVTV